MKQIKLAFLALIAVAFLACEKLPAYPVVKITHTIDNNNLVTFTAKSETDPVIMFYWWVYCDGTEIARKPAEGLSTYKHGEWDYVYSDTIRVQGESNRTYSVTLRYYDRSYEEYYVGDVAIVP